MYLYSLFKKYPRICTDTRHIVKNSLFFALRGDNFNANAFAAQALEQGCAYAIVDEAQYAVNERFIVVDNALEALQQLAQQHRGALGTVIVGITGTNGKTTTKELIASVLSEKFNIHYTQGNLNNHIGVPLTLLQLTQTHKIAIVEMGANHPREIAALCSIAAPQYGLITNVGRAHLEGFGSFEGVMQTKSELYEYIAGKGEAIFINSDNLFLNQMAENKGIGTKKRIEYSLTNTNSDVYGTTTGASPFLTMSCSLKNEKFDVKTNLIGEYNAENVLAAVCAGNFFGLKKEEIKRGLEKYKPSNSRSQLVETQRNKLIMDTYNANPSSMREAILNFAKLAAPHKTLILGDMLELGTISGEEHQKVVNLLNKSNLRNVFLVGKNFKNTENNCRCFENSDMLAEFLQTQHIDNQLILIKGSRGIQLEKTVKML
ncbi:MAG: UDP-N-acetylmuramoyl-tripeptide--D-alanyl-D-alanine ligase [Prevotellaceae bacterium]|jgi:UDP-N-acetylmuramoyl-tripeptide--D-alanyl-D-alanine ligase|nr:UDP-N-acetylmuramoyl-tripeptide--D-alanyl-D-alanine ligase [Prevotellaceae bacterium]